jgi:SAM-dependent methyltransferase
VPNCTFQTTDGTLAFPAARFDLIYSVLVLQHLPTRDAIGSAVRELVRTLRHCGLLCFQVPSRLPLRRRWQLRRRLYGLLRAAGLGERVLYERCGLQPIRMNAIAEREVRGLVAAAGGRVLACRPDAHAGPEVASRLYFVTRTPVAE